MFLCILTKIILFYCLKQQIHQAHYKQPILGLGLKKTLKFEQSEKQLVTGHLWITAFCVDLG